MKKYTRSTIKSTKGFGSNKPYLESIEQHGRAVIGVLTDDAGDPRALDFAYSVPMPGIKEPVLLTSYPSDKTTPWLLNAIGAHFREHGWQDLETDNIKLIEGQLGQHGEFPVAVRLLTEDEAAISHERYTCQADEGAPVVMLSVPDPNGFFPWEEECQPIVTYAEGKMTATLAGKVPEGQSINWEWGFPLLVDEAMARVLDKLDDED